MPHKALCKKGSLVVIFRQFCTADNEISYLLADPVTRIAALLDANVLAVKDYLAAIADMDLTLKYVMETHAQESHQSAAAHFRQQFASKLVAHSKAQLVCTDVAVKDDDHLFIGEECIQVLETPGHSRCSLSYYWHDRVFTGHTLLAGASGLCQRDDSDAAEMFNSIQNKLLTLPVTTLIYPGRVNSGQCVSNVAQELKANSEAGISVTQKKFIQDKQAEVFSKRWPQNYLLDNQRCNDYLQQHT